jgi:porin
MRLLIALAALTLALNSIGLADDNSPTATNFWTQPDLTGNWGGWRDQLDADGISPFANWTGEIWGTVNGGSQTGMTQDMLFSTGANIDLDKLISWPGASFYTELHWEQGQNPETNSGSRTNPSFLVSANLLRVYSLYFKQTLVDNQLRLKAGQFGADQDFFQTASAQIFLNAGFTSPNTLFGQSLVNGDSSTAQYPVLAPAFLARFDSKAWPVYLEAGIYSGDPGPDITSNHGFEWKTGSAAGELILGEAGWNYRLGALPGTVRAGAFYHSGQFTNWDTGKAESGIDGFYGMIEQTILQAPATDAQSTPNQILTAFAFAGNAGPNSRVAPNITYSVGVNWYGPISSRSKDIAAVAFDYTGFSPNYTASAFNSNGPGGSRASESVLELSYQAVFTPWFNLQPDVQIIFNPANSASHSTATVLGLRVVATF